MDITVVLHPGTSILGFPAFHPAKNKMAAWLQVTFPWWPSKWIPGASTPPPTGRHLPFVHIVHSSKTQLFTVSTHFDLFGFLTNEGEGLIYWGSPTLRYNANRLLGLVAGLSVLFCHQGNSRLGWRAESGILSMNFLVFIRLKSKVHILLQICVNNFHWSYSCISEFS